MIQQQILEANYWEHFKWAKDLAQIFPLDHPKRIKTEETMSDLLKKINKHKTENSNG